MNNYIYSRLYKRKENYELYEIFDNHKNLDAVKHFQTFDNMNWINKKKFKKISNLQYHKSYHIVGELYRYIFEQYNFKQLFWPFPVRNVTVNFYK